MPDLQLIKKCIIESRDVVAAYLFGSAAGIIWVHSSSKQEDDQVRRQKKIDIPGEGQRRRYQQTAGGFFQPDQLGCQDSELPSNQINEINETKPKRYANDRTKRSPQCDHVQHQKGNA